MRNETSPNLADYKDVGAGVVWMKKDDELNIMSWDSLKVLRPLHDVALAARLRLAINAQRLRLNYLPIVDVEKHSTVEVEALLRWPIKGDIHLPPLDFLPVAQAHGLMPKITRWIIRTALHDLSTWSQDGFELGINVNLFPAELDEDGFLEFVQEELGRSNLSPEKLGFEIAQKSVMELHQTQLNKIEQLRQLGVRLILDNVSNLDWQQASLSQQDWHTVKIDWQLIVNMSGDAGARRQVMPFIREANKRDIRVIAPGIHLHSEWQGIKKASRLFAQGFYFTPPQSAADLESWFYLSDWKPVSVNTPYAGENVSFAGERP